MLRMLLSLLLVVAPLAAQSTSPVIDSAPYLGGVLSTHADGTMSLARINGDGDLVIQSFTSNGGQNVQTSWTDKDGLEQTVTTKIPSGATQEERRRALLDHKNLVRDMKRVFPPADPQGG